MPIMDVAEITFEEARALRPSVLRQHICQSKVLVVRDATIDLGEYSGLMRSLGAPINHVLEQYCVPGWREVLIVSNLEVHGKAVGVRDGGSYWHTDMSYRSDSSVFTSLLASKVPAEGGHTEFIDCVEGLKLLLDARERGELDDTLQDLNIQVARVVHRFGNREQLRDESASSQPLTPSQTETLARPVIHPLLTTHPLTGYVSLYAVAGTSMEIEGLDEQESRQILNALFDFLLEYAPRYRHTYRPADLVIWDNLTTLHCGPKVRSTTDPNNCRFLYRMNVDFFGCDRA